MTSFCCLSHLLADLPTISDCPQLDSKPAAPGAAAAAARGETETEGNPSPLASPGLGRAWWKAPSMGRSPRKSPLKGGPAGNPTSPLKTPSKSAPAGALAAAAAAAAARSPANGGLANGGLASGGLANRVAPHGLANGGSCEAGTPARAPQENGVEPSAQEQSVDIPAIQVRIGCAPHACYLYVKERLMQAWTAGAAVSFCLRRDRHHMHVCSSALQSSPARYCRSSAALSYVCVLLPPNSDPEPEEWGGVPRRHCEGRQDGLRPVRVWQWGRVRRPV